MSPAFARALEVFKDAEGPSSFVKRAYDYFGRAGWNRNPRRMPMGGSGDTAGGLPGPEGFSGGAPGAEASGAPGGATGEQGAPWWQKGLTAAQYGVTAAMLPTLMRGIQSPMGALATAAKGGKLMKGMGYLGAAAGAYGDLKGAVTGDQGYESEGFWGQMGEQGLTTAGNLGSALATGNPYAVMGAGLASAANVGMNAQRAAGAVWDAAWNGGFGDKGAVKDDEIAAFKSRKATRQGQAPAAQQPPKAPAMPKADASGSTAGGKL